MVFVHDFFMRLRIEYLKVCPSTMERDVHAASRLIVLSSLAMGVSGCAVMAVGSAVTSVASTGIHAAATVGSLAVDGVAAGARAGARALTPNEKPAAGTRAQD
ncbi:hypothetical protein MCEMSEM23_01915 [Rhabdaerophilaceae bacterium]